MAPLVQIRRQKVQPEKPERPPKPDRKEVWLDLYRQAKTDARLQPLEIRFLVAAAFLPPGFTHRDAAEWLSCGRLKAQWARKRLQRLGYLHIEWRQGNDHLGTVLVTPNTGFRPPQQRDVSKEIAGGGDV